MSSREIKPDVLLKVYKERVEQEIYAAIMADVRPAIEKYVRAAAIEAVNSLQGALQERYDVMTRDTVVRIELKFNGEDVKR